jgi:hypothetical protein
MYTAEKSFSEEAPGKPMKKWSDSWANFYPSVIRFLDPMKVSTLLLLLLFSLTACDNSPKDAPILKDELTEIIKDTSSSSSLKEDTLQITPVVNADKVVPKKNTVKPKVERVEKIEVVEDVPPFYYDPMDDPDYIGTPCGDYDEFGRCRRHSQHKYYLNEGPEFFIDPLR